MKKRFWVVILTSLLLVFGMSAAIYGADAQETWNDHAAASFAGGDGSEANPYQIGTAEELAKLSKDVTTGEEYEGKYFKLTSNIDLSEHTWVPIGLYQWYENGGTTNEPFRGSLDGSGHTISNMKVDQRTDRYTGGLFGNVCNASAVDNEIKDLTVKDARIDNKSGNDLTQSNNGILAAFVLANEGHTVKVTNVETSGVIRLEGRSNADINGGMLGNTSRVTVKNCHVKDINITGEKGVDNTGGFVGMDAGSTYEDCTATGYVDGKWTMGGFVGCATTSTYEDPDTASSFKHCMADVEVHASDWNSAGFVAYAEYTVFRNCVAKGDVTSTVTNYSPKIGGFAGNDIKITASNCHAAGKLTSTHPEMKPGGFAGAKNYTSGTYANNSYDSEKNPDIKATHNNKGEMVDVKGIEGVSTQEVKANICRDYDGKHQVEEVAKKEATCTEDGREGYYICKACETKYKDADGKEILEEDPAVIQATGHKFGEWKVIKEPTTKAEGTEERTCENCSEKETRSIAKLKPSVPEPSAPEKKIASVAFSKKAYVYNGKTKKPAVKVKDAQGKVIPAKEYTVKYPKGRKKVGTYTVSVKLKTGAKNTVKAAFRIIPKTTQIRSLSKGRNSFTVKWFRKGPQVTGYQVQYSTSKNFNNPKSKRIKGYNHNTKKVKKLGKKKTYYVRVRTYKKIGNATYFAKWSKVKKITTR